MYSNCVYFGQATLRQDSAAHRQRLVGWLRPNGKFKLPEGGCTELRKCLAGRGARWSTHCDSLAKEGTHFDLVAMFAQGRICKKHVNILHNLRSPEPIFFAYPGATETMHFAYDSERPDKAGHYEPLANIRKAVWQKHVEGRDGAIEVGGFAVDMRRLRLGQWLNDTVVNGVLHLMGLEFKDIAFLNSFIYCCSIGQYSARTWRGAIRGKRAVFFACHINLNHWVGALVDLEGHTITISNSIKDQDDDDKVYKRVTEFIAERHSTEHDWARKPLKVPQQGNGCDCGVMLIASFDCAARKKQLGYSVKDVPTMRRSIAQYLYQGEWQALVM